MNPLDIALILVVLILTIVGLRRGFLLGAYELLFAVIALLLAARLYGPLAELLGRFIDAREALLNVAAFVAIIVGCQVLASASVGRVARLIRRATGFVPGGQTLDRVAGIAPGFVQGLLAATILTLLAGFLPADTLAGQQLADSRLGLRLYRESTNVALRAVNAAGIQIADFVALTPRSSGDGYLLPFQVDDELEADLDAEDRMLALVNAERVEAGLQPLEPDGALVVVGRAHAVEMFNEGYFAHESPNTGSPFDRLDAAGIEYGLAGENLAFAPNVEIAHEGLMDSPGHRANILEPGFGRVGIAAVRSPDHGLMFVQVFSN